MGGGGFIWSKAKGVKKILMKENGPEEGGLGMQLAKRLEDRRRPRKGREFVRFLVAAGRSWEGDELDAKEAYWGERDLRQGISKKRTPGRAMA